MEKCGSDGEAGDTFACRMCIACGGSRTKCRGHNVAVKILWGQNVIGQNVESFCPRHFVHNILSTAFCQRHFVQWHFVHITFCPRHFSRDILSGDILSGHPCRYTAAVQPARQKWGYVESQYPKFKQWSLVRTLPGWLVCGRSDRWIAGGWIYSKPVGWLVCLLVSVVWSDLWSVVGLPAGLFAIQSVGWFNHLTSLPYPTYHRKIGQPSIHLSEISAWISGIGGSTSPRFRSDDWLRWGYLTHACKLLAKFGAYFI